MSNGLKPNSGNKGSVTKPQFKTVAEENRYLAKENEKNRKTIAEQGKIIAEQAKTIAALKKDNREQKRTIKQLRGAVSRLEKSLVAQSRRTAKAEKALDMVLARLNVADNAHAPTSRQIMRETRKDQAVEDKRKTAERPGPPDGHPGTTDERPATHRVRARLPACDNCGGRWIEVTGMSEEVVTDVEVVKYKKIKMKNLAGKCVGCGHAVEGRFLASDVEACGAAPPGPPGGHHPAPVSGFLPAPGGPGPLDAPSRGGHPEPPGETVEVGNGLVQVRRAETETVVGDVMEAEDIDEEPLEVPEKGTLGFNLLHVILLLWRHRVTVRGTADVLARLYELALSTATVWSALLRMAEALRPEYDAILERILRSPYVHIDETTLRVGKKKMWVWIVATGGMSYYFVDTRAINRIKEILDGYDGIIIVDGYHTSGLLAPYMVQRCTAHMDRDFKKWAKIEGMVTPERRIMRNFADRGRALIYEARDAKEDGCGPERYGEMCARLDALLGYYDRYPEIAKQVAKVRNAGHSLLTFMKYEYVDSTNNLAERELREVVKHRAVKSLLRTMQGAEIFSILLTILMTHKDGNILDLLKKHLGRSGPPATSDGSPGHGDG